jgi:site-specific recombinase XerD
MNKSKPTDFAVALSDFLFHYLPEQKGLSENTIKSYADALTLFLLFCETELNVAREKLFIKDLDVEKVERYFDWLENTRHNSACSRNQRRAAINSFFKYLQRKNPGYVMLYQQIRAIPRKNDKRQTVQHLSVEAVKELLKSPNLQTKDGRRDFAILSLMYESGARVSEIADLTIADLRFGRNGATVHLLGKGKKSREVPLIGSVETFMKRYLNDNSQYRTRDKSEPLFCNRVKQKLTRAGIAYILEKHVEQVRQITPDLFPVRVYPHILRHSRAMHWLESGIDLQYIKDLLGHAELATTEVYAQLNTNMKREILESVHPQAPDTETESWADDKNLIDWLRGFNS